VRSRNISNVGRSLDRWPKICYLELLRASEGTLSRLSRLYLQSLTSNNPLWARVVGSGPFSLCVIDKEGLCPSTGSINGLMMMMKLWVNIKFVNIPAPPRECGLNEVWNTCANARCLRRICADVGKPLICLRPWKCKPGCICREGYVRNQRSCILEKDCNSKHNH
jgi:hypothetical protein